jgi:predicted transcriptional regulator
MQHKITLPQLKKYDITQKVIEALADAESRAIIFSIIKKGKTAANLSQSLKIPLSSVYKKLSDLEDLTLIEIEKTIMAENGKRFKIYKSRINKAEILIKKPEPTLSLSAN